MNCQDPTSGGAFAHAVVSTVSAKTERIKLARRASSDKKGAATARAEPVRYAQRAEQHLWDFAEVVAGELKQQKTPRGCDGVLVQERTHANATHCQSRTGTRSTQSPF